MHIVVPAGGIGAARFLRGLRAAAPDADITVVGNTADDITLFQRWIADWQDVVEFEVVPVVEGKTTREALGPML